MIGRHETRRCGQADVSGKASARAAIDWLSVKDSGERHDDRVLLAWSLPPDDPISYYARTTL